MSSTLLKEQPQWDTRQRGNCVMVHAARNIQIQSVYCHMMHCFDAQLDLGKSKTQLTYRHAGWVLFTLSIASEHSVCLGV
jgi:hypothetical protein